MTPAVHILVVTHFDPYPYRRQLPIEAEANMCEFWCVRFATCECPLYGNFFAHKKRQLHVNPPGGHLARCARPVTS